LPEFKTRRDSEDDWQQVYPSSAYVPTGFYCFHLAGFNVGAVCGQNSIKGFNIVMQREQLEGSFFM